MKRSLIALATVSALGLGSLAATNVFADPVTGPRWGGDAVQLAHYDGRGAGRGAWGPGMRGGMGPGMMGYGAGPGMMGYGAGPGMMGYGGHPMMGYGMGPGMMGYGADPDDAPCPGLAAATNGEPLSVEDARKTVEQRLQWMGNDRLKVGTVEAKDDNTIVAEIVTTDGSLVDKFEINRKTGFMRPVR